MTDSSIEVACPHEGCPTEVVVPFQEWSKATFTMDGHGEFTLKTIPEAMREHLASEHPEDPRARRP